MNIWDEVCAENASEREAQLSDDCTCGVVIRDHYDRKGLWRPCEEINPHVSPSAHLTSEGV